MSEAASETGRAGRGLVGSDVKRGSAPAVLSLFHCFGALPVGSDVKRGSTPTVLSLFHYFGALPVGISVNTRVFPYSPLTFPLLWSFASR